MTEPEAGRHPARAGLGEAATDGVDIGSYNIAARTVGAVNIFQGSGLPAVAISPDLHSAIISTTLLSAKATYRLEAASLPHRFLTVAGSPLPVAEQVLEVLGLHPVVNVASPGDLPAAIAALLSLEDGFANDDDIVGSFEGLRQTWPSIRSHLNPPPPELVNFAEYAAMAEAVLVEESPPRRTSVAAQAAARLASRIMTTGSAATLCSTSLNDQHVVAIVVVGGGATIVLSVAGAAVTILCHCAAKSLKLP